MHLSLKSYRSLLFLIGALGIALAAAASFINARIEHNRAWDAFEQQLKTETRLLAEHAGLSFSAAEQVLRVISTEASSKTLEALASDPLFWQRLQQVHGHAPQVSAFIMADADGRVLLSSTQFPAPQDIRIDDHRHFQAVRDGADLYIGAALTWRASASSVVPVTIPLDGPDGQFAGSATALLNLDYFSRFYEALSPGENRRVGLLLDDGTPLVAYPPIGTPGVPWVNAALAETIFTAPFGVHRLQPETADPTSVLGYRRVAGYPVFAAVGVEQDRLLGLTQPIWTRNTVILLIFTLGMVTALLVIDRAFQLLRSAQLQLAKHNRELTTLSLTDSLTGIANRRAFEQAFEREWRRAKRKQRPVGLLLVDADHFKQFNDTYGHTAGDEALRRLASAVDDVVARAGDVVARYGGEELVVLLPDTDLYGTLQVAERVHTTLRDEPIPFPDSPDESRVTVSIGASVTLPDESLAPQAFIETADSALYAAKAQGRNQTAFKPYPEEQSATETAARTTPARR